MGLEGKSAEEIERLATWAQGVLTNPETRTDALKLAKRQDPNFRNPELDLAEKIAESHAASDAKIEKLEGSLRQEQLERKRSEKKAELLAKGYDIEIVEKCMMDNHIGSYESAMKLLDAESRLAPVTAPVIQSTATSMPTDMKEIAKNPGKWARDKAAEVLNEFAQRGGRAA